MYIALADENAHYIPRISIQDIFRQFETAVTFQSYANICLKMDCIYFSLTNMYKFNSYDT